LTNDQVTAFKASGVYTNSYTTPAISVTGSNTSGTCVNRTIGASFASVTNSPTNYTINLTAAGININSTTQMWYLIVDGNFSNTIGPGIVSVGTATAAKNVWAFPIYVNDTTC
jgi:hypothetical protein